MFSFIKGHCKITLAAKKELKDTALTVLITLDPERADQYEQIMDEKNFSLIFEELGNGRTEYQVHGKTRMPIPGAEDGNNYLFSYSFIVESEFHEKLQKGLQRNGIWILALRAQYISHLVIRYSTGEVIETINGSRGQTKKTAEIEP